MKLWLGDSHKARLTIVISSSLIFGIPHLYQGGYGVLHAILLGGILGYMYYQNKGNLWLLVVTHAAYDLFAIWLIYKGWDKAVAKFIFP